MNAVSIHGRGHQGRTALGRVPAVLVVLLANCVFACRGTGQEMSNGEATAQQPNSSLYWVERVTALREVPLPDEWYDLAIADSGKRIDEMLWLIDRRADL